MTKKYDIKHFFDEATWTVTYVVSDPETKDAIVIDPVLDYDPLGSQTNTTSIDQVVDFLESQGLNLRASLETHAHADHLSAGPLLKKKYGVPVVIGVDITKVQETFKGVFNLPADTPIDGSQFDQLLHDGKDVAFGSIELKPLATPGHTPACMSFVVGDAVFTGDAVFIEDFGTGRTDFPAGSAKDLYQSVHEVLYELPEDTRLFVGHDYQPGGRELRFETTVGAERRRNIQLKAETTKEDFVEFREGRDAGLKAPRLLFPSIQVNAFGGCLPEEESNGVRYLKIPLNLRAPTDCAGVAAAEAAE